MSDGGVLTGDNGSFIGGSKSVKGTSSLKHDGITTKKSLSEHWPRDSVSSEEIINECMYIYE